MASRKEETFCPFPFHHLENFVRLAVQSHQRDKTVKCKTVTVTAMGPFIFTVVMNILYDSAVHFKACCGMHLIFAFHKSNIPPRKITVVFICFEERLN